MKAFMLALAIIIFILQIRLLSSDGGIGEWVSLQSKLDDLQTEIEALEKRNALLKKEVTALQSSPKAIETLARQKLGMIAEDEVFIKVIELPSQPVKPVIEQPVDSPLKAPGSLEQVD
ncbi:MAG: septum formation initiator [Piscirickettsiaceae bacterium CG_4_9_14_3_um_filter_43_564]|nr:MAG: septum formation initiator [Piscirickettsiaceae bacterium CG18_big_fil_WC_8_21_14_2_50_44_103]PIU38570.1 MAG: septum formation initiator [Piscirickettsiaceae bacterium CG07_land_8_20_14_0_80_44_28]PIW58428.1 MAG: septum formation initiator [Piscirickettsiaceae bacterium CG12_big_fil_rev_8_21_14_0_65_44_934]PIW78716.1 MAG: septum formation initiator [Piscirickettsiaceae bacterium CG_4_8_14_3_um_filter_44_38]PIX79261.1 MAG: septum formation initiator [Piscirickettsiaceae bacterium CG_4_10